MHLPEHWQMAALGDLDGASRRTIDPGAYPDESFEYYSIPAYQETQSPLTTKGAEIASAKLILEPGSVLFGKLNPRVEKVWRVRQATGLRQIGSTEWLPIVPNEKVDGEFLYFMCWSDHVMHLAKGQVSGSTPSRQRVDPTAFYRIRVPLPPLEEQKQLAGVLAAAQRGDERQERLIALTAELKKALMQKLFTKGTRGEPQKQTKIGLLPESWIVRELREFAHASGGVGFPPSLQGRSSGDIPFCKVSDMNLPGNEIELRSSNNWVDESDLLTLKATPCPAGSTVFPKIGETIHTNKKRRLFRPTLVDNNVMCVVVTDESVCSPRYLFQWFLNIELAELASPGTVPSITSARIKSLAMPKPPLEEQTFMGELFDALDEKVQRHRRIQERCRELFRTLLQQLMTAQIRVGDLDLSALEGVAAESAGAA